MTGTGIRRTRIVCKLHFIIINLPTVWLFRSIFGQFSKTLSRSAHRIPNFTNPAYFVCLLYEYFFQIKVLNWYHNTLKNANITRCIKKTPYQQLKLGKLNFRIRKVGWSMSWTRYTNWKYFWVSKKSRQNDVHKCSTYYQKHFIIIDQLWYFLSKIDSHQDRLMWLQKFFSKNLGIHFFLTFFSTSSEDIQCSVVLPIRDMWKLNMFIVF